MTTESRGRDLTDVLLDVLDHHPTGGYSGGWEFDLSFDEAMKVVEQWHLGEVWRLGVERFPQLLVSHKDLQQKIEEAIAAACETDEDAYRYVHPPGLAEFIVKHLRGELP